MPGHSAALPPPPWRCGSPMLRLWSLHAISISFHVHLNMREAIQTIGLVQIQYMSDCVKIHCLTFYIPSGCKLKTTGTTSQQDPLEWLAWRFSLKEEVKYLCTWKVTRNKQYWPNCRLPGVKLQANQNSNSKAQNVHHVAAQKGLQWLQETWHTYWLSLSASQLRLLGIHGLTTICGTELP